MKSDGKNSNGKCSDQRTEISVQTNVVHIQIRTVKHVSEGNGRWFSEPSVSCWDAATGESLKKWKPPEIPPRETDKDYTHWTAQDGRLSVDEKIVFWRFEVEVQTPKGSVDMAKRDMVIRASDASSRQRRSRPRVWEHGEQSP